MPNQRQSLVFEMQELIRQQELTSNTEKQIEIKNKLKNLENKLDKIQNYKPKDILEKIINERILKQDRILWYDLYASLVYLISKRSRDKNTQVGAIIIDPENHIILSTGYNGIARGVDDNKPERYERPEKYYWFTHAETNAIYNATRHGIKIEGCTLICSHFPCSNCADAIIQTGIKVVHHFELNIADNRYDDSMRALKKFKEADVKIKYIGD